MRGFFLYLLGIVGLCGTVPFFALMVLLLSNPNDVSLVVAIIAVIVYASAVAVALGFHAMLLHLYRAISRSDVNRDRPVHGTWLYMVGLLFGVMTGATFTFFAVLPLFVRPQANPERILWGTVPSGLLTACCGIVMMVGTLLMLRDTLRRHDEVEERRAAQRYGSADTVGDETQVIERDAPLPHSDAIQANPPGRRRLLETGDEEEE